MSSRADKRLAYLESVVAQGTADSFARYGLALEYAGRERIADALATFETLRGLDPDYVPMYLMCGTMLAKAGRKNDARTWLEQGVVTAKKKGDTHALSEIETALLGL